MFTDFLLTDRSARAWQPPTPLELNKRPAKCWESCSSRLCYAGHHSSCWTLCSPSAQRKTARYRTTWPRFASGWDTCLRQSTRLSTRYSTRPLELHLSGDLKSCERFDINYRYMRSVSQCLSIPILLDRYVLLGIVYK